MLFAKAAAACILALFASAQADPPPIGAAAELHAAIDLLKTYNVNRDKVDWATVTAKADAMIAKAKSAEEAHPAIWFVIRQLGENHTHLVPSAVMKAVAAGPQSKSQYAKMVADYSGLPTVRRLSRDIMLLVVPQFQSTEERDRAYVAVLRNALVSAKAQNICRFVVDLRGNTGGDSYTMINGVEGLLGGQPWGYWEWPGAVRQPWPVVDKPFEGDVNKNAPYAEPVAHLGHAVVAVLLDRKTLSASEMTAIAFEGRPHTRFFGEPSGGLVTGNSAFTLPDGAMLAVASSWPADRLGRPYRVAVVPDDETSAGEPTVAAAVTWLKKQSCR